MLLFEVMDEAGPLNFDVKVGSVHVKLNAVPEELERMEQHGVKLPDSIAVVYAHELPMSKTKMMDKLKLRNGYEGDTYQREVGTMIDQSIKSLMLKNPASMDRKWEQSRNAVTMLQNYIKAGGKSGAIVVPIPSSSGVTKMIAASLAKQYGLNVVDILSKNAHPPISKRYLQSKYPDRDHSGVKDHDDLQRDLRVAKDRMDSAEEAATAPGASKAAYQDFMLKKQQYELRVQRVQRQYQRKTNMSDPSTDYGKAYYNTMIPNDDAKQLAGKYVIIVDDNVVSGSTVGDTIKALYQQGIAPKGIVAFAPHFLARKEKEEQGALV